MLSSSQKRGYSGFTLIELLIGVLLIGILSSIAIPSFDIWIRNTEIRSAAESVLGGMQRARAEAVSRNRSVSFDLGAGMAWSINEVGGASNPVATNGSVEVSPAVTRVPDAGGGATAITFNNMGAVQNPNADGSLPITGITFSSSALAPAQRKNMKVTIGIGGNARMCDPSLWYATNPRGC